MLSNKKLANLYICRRCLNKHSKLQYKNYELKYKYYYYHFKCSECQGMHHIVKGVKLLYIWKLLFTTIPPVDLTDDPEVIKAMDRKQRKIKFKRWLNW